MKRKPAIFLAVLLLVSAAAAALFSFVNFSEEGALRSFKSPAGLLTSGGSEKAPGCSPRPKKVFPSPGDREFQVIEKVKSEIKKEEENKARENKARENKASGSSYGKRQETVKKGGLSLREKVGQLFIVRPEALDFSLSFSQQNDLRNYGKTALSPAMRRAFSDYPPGGMVLFAKNIVSPKQLKDFNASLMSCGSIKPFIATDEEGGKIVRIAKNPNFSVRKFEDAYDEGESGEPKKARERGRVIGAYLKEFGFNMDFAPVADVFTNPSNTVIGHRAFSSDPFIAADFAGEMASGLKSSGIIPVFKHFPGHGDTKEDSHKQCAVSYKTKDELLNCELIPFGRAGNGDCVMAGHIALPNYTGNDTIAPMSSQIIDGLLRRELHFGGLVITDSFSMKAVTDKYSSGAAALAALRAGCDIILMPADYREAFDAVYAAVQNGSFTQRELDAKLSRILSFKMAAGLLP